MVTSESPMPSPINRMMLRAPEPLMASRIASVWSPPRRAAPPVAVRSPLAGRSSGLPLESALSSLPHPARTSIAAALKTPTALYTDCTDM